MILAQSALGEVPQGYACEDTLQVYTSEEHMAPIPIRVVAGALSIALGALGCTTSTNPSAKDGTVAGTIRSTRMADGKEWMTENLDVNASPSYCYDDAELNCRRYGRLYTWESAQRACELLGEGWRL